MTSSTMTVLIVPLLLSLVFDPASAFDFNLNSSSDHTQDLSCSFDATTSQIEGILQINIVAILDTSEERLATINKISPFNVTIVHDGVIKASGKISKNHGFLSIRIKSASSVLKFACRALVLDYSEKAATVEKIVHNSENGQVSNYDGMSSDVDLEGAFQSLEDDHDILVEKLNGKAKVMEDLSEKVIYTKDSVSEVLGIVQSNEKNSKSIAEKLSNTKDLITENKEDLVAVSKKMDALEEKLAKMYEMQTEISSKWNEMPKTSGQSETTSVRANSCNELKKNYGLDLPPRVTITTPDGLSLLCDTETAGGGWTIFQRRINGEVDFYRNWTEYENGFGSHNSSFWLGLKHVSKMTAERQWKLRVDFEFKAKMYYAEYQAFQIGDSAEKYKLNIFGYFGTAGDNLLYHKNKPFTTFDNDNDDASGNCAKLRKGAWWYGNCQKVHLNGQWGSKELEEGVNWLETTGTKASATYTEMKIRAY